MCLGGETSGSQAHALSHYTYLWSPDQGGREKGGMGSNAAELPSVWGEADVHGKYLKTEHQALPPKEVTCGQVPNLRVIKTATTTCQGTCVHQP